MQEVMEWLDSIIENMKEQKALSKFNNQIMICGAKDYIQMFKGIEIVADELGIELQSKPHAGRIPPYAQKVKLSFDYKGYEVFQFSDGEQHV